MIKISRDIQERIEYKSEEELEREKEEGTKESEAPSSWRERVRAGCWELRSDPLVFPFPSRRR